MRIAIGDVALGVVAGMTHPSNAVSSPRIFFRHDLMYERVLLPFSIYIVRCGRNKWSLQANHCPWALASKTAHLARQKLASTKSTSHTSGPPLLNPSILGGAPGSGAPRPRCLQLAVGPGALALCQQDNVITSILRCFCLSSCCHFVLNWQQAATGKMTKRKVRLTMMTGTL